MGIKINRTGVSAMKTASSDLISHLNTATEFLMADLLTFTQLNGTILRYTLSDHDISYGGNTFSASGPRIDRGSWRLIRGVEVDDLTLTVYPAATDLVNGIAFLTAVATGAFDGATVKLERAFFTDWALAAVGAVVLFTGRVSDITLGRTTAEITVKSDLELLNTKLPRKLYQPGCGHTLYDAACGLVKASWVETGAVIAGSTRSIVNGNLTTQAAGFYDLGTIRFTSGVNNGVSRTIKTYTPGIITVSMPLPNIPGVGDAISIYPGCDKTQSTCTSKFNNLANFRGFPYVPVPETAY